jgi:hypothetical protein
MNDFLRRVMERRAAEMEAALDSVDMTRPEYSCEQTCRLCGGRCNVTKPQLTVCFKCGGRRKERQLQADSKRLSGRAPMRLCSTCGTVLRHNNTRGKCVFCQGRKEGT